MYVEYKVNMDTLYINHLKVCISQPKDVTKVSTESRWRCKFLSINPIYAGLFRSFSNRGFS